MAGRDDKVGDDKVAGRGDRAHWRGDKVRDCPSSFDMINRRLARLLGMLEGVARLLGMLEGGAVGETSLFPTTCILVVLCFRTDVLSKLEFDCPCATATLEFDCPCATATLEVESEVEIAVTRVL